MSIAEKLTTIAENQQKVYDAGYAAGQTGGGGGYDKGFEDGKKAEYDRFWDAYQNKGARTSYSQAFYGDGWNDETFRPKYNIGIGSANLNGLLGYSAVTDLAAILEQQGVILDFSSCLYVNSVFNNMSNVTHIPIINAPKSNQFTTTFAGAQKLHTIDKIILSDIGTATFGDTFYFCYALENISFDGVIGKNISFSYSSLLTTASVQSIIDHLKDLTGQAAQTLTFHADVGAKLTEAQKAAITAKNWTLVY